MTGSFAAVRHFSANTAKEDVATGDEVLIDALRLEGERTDLLIGLLIRLRLFGAERGTRCPATVSVPMHHC